MSNRYDNNLILDYIFSKLDEKISKIEKLDAQSNKELLAISEKLLILNKSVKHRPTSSKEQELSIYQQFNLDCKDLLPIQKKLVHDISYENHSLGDLHSESEIEDIMLNYSQGKTNRSIVRSDYHVDSEETMTDQEGMNPFAPKFEIPRDLTSDFHDKASKSAKKNEIIQFSRYKAIRLKKSGSQKNFESSEESDPIITNFESRYLKSEKVNFKKVKKTETKKDFYKEKVINFTESPKKKKEETDSNSESVLTASESPMIQIKTLSPPKKELENLNLISTNIDNKSTQLGPTSGFSFRDNGSTQKISESFINLGFRTPEKNEMWDDYKQMKQNFKFLTENRFNLRSYTPQPRKVKLDQPTKSLVQSKSEIKIPTTKKSIGNSKSLDTTTTKKGSSQGKIDLSNLISNTSINEANKSSGERKRQSMDNYQKKSVTTQIKSFSKEKIRSSLVKTPPKRKILEEVVTIQSPEFNTPNTESTRPLNRSMYSPSTTIANENQMNYSIAEINSQSSMLDFSEFHSPKIGIQNAKQSKSPVKKRFSTGNRYLKDKSPERVSEKIEKCTKKVVQEMSPEKFSTNRKSKAKNSPSSTVVIVEWSENYK